MGKRKKQKSARAKKKEARRLKRKSFQHSVTRDSYNIVLFEARQKAGLRRFAFARALGIFPLLYPFIESGYLKPGRIQKSKITAYLEEDYQPYCEGISSYPEELPEKPRNAFTAWFFKLLGSTPFRILLILLFIACLGSLSYGFKESDDLAEEEGSYYPDMLHHLRYGVFEKGSSTLYYSADSPLDVNLVYTEIISKDTDKLVSIKSDKAGNGFTRVELLSRRWTEEGRVDMRHSLTEAPETISLNYTEYATDCAYQCQAKQQEDGSYILGDVSFNLFQDADVDKLAEVQAIFRAHVPEFDRDIENLIQEKLGLTLELRPFLREVSAGQDAISERTTRYMVYMAAGFVLGLLLLFCIVYCLLYGTRKGVAQVHQPRGNLIRYARRREPATDIKFPPFLPETLLSLFGSYLLYRSSARFIYLALSFSFSIAIDLDTALGRNQDLMQLFYVAMFLLYFLDFDSFLDDRRVQGRIFMYFLFYIALYTAEISLIAAFSDSPSLVNQLITQVRLPNMFGSICCYFIIMHFLFYTPKSVKSRKGLILYRCCSLIPVLIILGSKLIFNGSDRFFEWKLPYYVRYLFNGERITFSLLCIGYLYGLYFLRLHYEKRYGTENALKYFNGNRFLWQKNILTCLLVLVIALASFLLQDNPVASVFGVGESQELLYLLPLLLFYHPHKGPRNRLVDFVTMGVYLAALCYGYVVGGLILLIGMLVT